MPRANWSVLERYAVAVGPPQVVSAFNSIVEDAVALIHRLILANRQLRAARDLLLPRLMSGDINVENLAIALSEAAA